MTHEEIEEYYLDTPIKMITEEEYEEKLEILPPEKWETVFIGSIFRMSEYKIGNVTQHYIAMSHHGKKLFLTLFCRTNKPYADIMAQIRSFVDYYAEGWHPSDTREADYLGATEVNGDIFHILNNGERLIFGSPCNSCFLESGFMIYDRFEESLDNALLDLYAELDVYYSDGPAYVSRIICKEGM